jgi:hypothetical protein
LLEQWQLGKSRFAFKANLTVDDVAVDMMAGACSWLLHVLCLKRDAEYTGSYYY